MRRQSETATKHQTVDQMQRNRNRSKDKGPQDKSQAEEVAPKNVIDDLNIQKKLRTILDESDDEHGIFFKDVNDLMSIFENLEEKNLSLIQQGQENEQQIEEKKREFDGTCRVEEAKLSQLE